MAIAHTVQLKGQQTPVQVGKIVCVGRNYVDHISELNNQKPDQPMFFMKPATALCSLEAPIQIPSYSKKVRHELELALLIKSPLKNAAEDQVRAAVAGYAVALDVTLQDVQEGCKERRHPWEIAKAFDGSCPISPFVPAEDVADPQDLHIQMQVNGEMRHNDSTKLMIWSINTLLAAASIYFTLEEGDILLTGTPAGVGSLNPGDQLEMSIAEVGNYQSSVAA